MRTFKVTKTRAGKPKLTLYENGVVVMSKPVSSIVNGNRIGKLWAESDV
jgi:hypothetical protein